MTWTLLQKELRQHWLALLAVLAASAISDLFIIAATAAKGGSETPLDGLRIFLMLIGSVSALVINHRLVVVEYQSKTQLFLEGLPVPRWRMVALKYGLASVTIFLVVGMSFAIACFLSWRHEGMTPRFLQIIALRSFSIAWFLQSLCFLMGLTGRYRLALYLTILLCFAFLAEEKALEFRHFGPFALLDSHFAYEREEIPWQALNATWGLSLIFTFFAAGLTLVREGSVAALLAEKMSHREKVLIAAIICGLLFATSTLSEKAKKSPFDLKNAAEARAQGVSVKVASGAGENDPGSVRLANHVATELGAMREFLGMKELPFIFVVRRQDLDANRFERGELAKSEGVHVHANFTSKDWEDPQFLAWLIPEVLIVASHERAKLESRRWVLDGFGWFWVKRGHPEAGLTNDRALALRALYGVEHGFSLADLDGWLSFRERIGEDIAAGVAWSGLVTLARREGAESCQKFLQKILGSKQSKDFRALFSKAPWPQVLREQTRTSPQTFFQQWREELASAHLLFGEELAQLPRLRGKVNFMPVSASSRKVKFRIIVDPVPVSDVRYSFLYQQVTGFNEELSAKSFQREQNSYLHSPKAELPGTYSREQRLCWTVALYVPALGCQVISGFNRDQIP